MAHPRGAETRRRGLLAWAEGEAVVAAWPLVAAAWRLERHLSAAPHKIALMPVEGVVASLSAEPAWMHPAHWHSGRDVSILALRGHSQDLGYRPAALRLNSETNRRTHWHEYHHRHLGENEAKLERRFLIPARM